MSDGDKARQFLKVMDERIAVWHSRSGTMFDGEVVADELNYWFKRFREEPAALPSQVTPQESPLAWAVFVPNDPQGFDYRVFADEQQASRYDDTEGVEVEIVPLYRASALRSPQAPRKHLPTQKLSRPLTDEELQLVWDAEKITEEDLRKIVVQAKEANALRSHTAPLPEEEMCPNCVTPWKCNGPHVPALRSSTAPKYEPHIKDNGEKSRAPFLTSAMLGIEPQATSDSDDDALAERLCRLFPTAIDVGNALPIIEAVRSATAPHPDTVRINWIQSRAPQSRWYYSPMVASVAASSSGKETVREAIDEAMADVAADDTAKE